MKERFVSWTMSYHVYRIKGAGKYCVQSYKPMGVAPVYIFTIFSRCVFRLHLKELIQTSVICSTILSLVARGIRKFQDGRNRELAIVNGPKTIMGSVLPGSGVQLYLRFVRYVELLLCARSGRLFNSDARDPHHS